MLNALNYRPAEGQRERELTELCCWNTYPDDNDSVIVVSDDEDEQTIPMLLKYGLYFISGVTLEGTTTLRMGGADTVSQECIERLYLMRRHRDLNVAFRIKAISEEGNNRTQNRRKEPVDVALVAERGDLVAEDTPLSDLGITVQPLPRAHGADIRSFFPANRMGQDQDREEERIDDLVKRIWRQFPYDIFENAPNHRYSHQGSHLRLSTEQRRDATIKVFQTTDLRQLFSRVVVKILTPEKWRDLVFRRYFPEKGFKQPKHLQNFPRLRYYQDWNTLMDGVSAEDAETVRESFWETFETFHWLPLTDSDRLWNTKVVKPTTPEWLHLPRNDNKPVVRIGLNGGLVANARRIRIYKEQGLGINRAGGSQSDPMVID